MSKGGTKSLDEIEEIAREYISKTTGIPKNYIKITDAELEDIAGQPIYSVSGYSEWNQKYGGIFGFGQAIATIQQKFKMQIEAWTGNIVGKKIRDPEQVK